MFDSGERRTYLVECYWPSVDAQGFLAAAQRARQAAQQLQGQGRELRFLASILVLIDETVFYLFDGEEAEVRTASEQAGIPFERVLESIRVTGGPPDEEKR